MQSPLTSRPKRGTVVAIKSPAWISEMLLGVAMSLFVLWLARLRQAGKRNVLHATLEPKALAGTGKWSYSLLPDP
ncbi:hypothetical protein [Arthrobacter sp. SLBN-122]|uniref:hypothetical protein n=1 Tax=Arthrobacter sp. SLBN-122 TaxID=2768455 RepID=UPI00114EC0E3|nr:hypothetical protein [Arthrobacter sp. SLBN-122]TQJ33595.1 hypothetical protein FBY36_0811 [Arthrobacter sp. SLBN-122]